MYPHERSLVKRLEGRPFAIVGVNSDKDREALRDVLSKERITWRSFWNGPEGTRGPISKAWGVQGWPTLVLIDAKGVIRKRWLGAPDGEVLDAALETCLAEVERER